MLERDAVFDCASPCDVPPIARQPSFAVLDNPAEEALYVIAEQRARALVGIDGDDKLTGVLGGRRRVPVLLEAEMTARYDPAQMTKLGIYPNGWSGPDAQWLLREFRNLRAFYADASTKGFAIVTCLV